MSSAYFSFGNSRIHYSYWGTGGRLLLCFHGYGESAASFAFLGEALGGDFTILAVDLPHHGQTEWNDGLYLSPRDLLHVLQKIAMQFALDQETWWCLGYSMAAAWPCSCSSWLRTGSGGSCFWRRMGCR